MDSSFLFSPLHWSSTSPLPEERTPLLHPNGTALGSAPRRRCTGAQEWRRCTRRGPTRRPRWPARRPEAEVPPGAQAAAALGRGASAHRSGGGAPKGQRLLSRSPPATTGSGDTSRRWRMADGGGGACGARQQRGTAHGGAHRAGGPGVGLGSNRSPFNLYFIFIFTKAGQKAGPFWASGTGLGQQAARPSSRFLVLSVKRK